MFTWGLWWHADIEMEDGVLGDEEADMGDGDGDEDVDTKACGARDDEDVEMEDAQNDLGNIS